MSMEDYKKGFDEGYDAAYLKGRDEGHDDGYAAGYKDCTLDRRENWINHELNLLLEVMEKFCETDEDREKFDKMRREGEFHIDPPHLMESRPINRIEPHLRNVLGNAIMTGKEIAKVKF